MSIDRLPMTFDFYVLLDGVNGAKRIELLQDQRMEEPPETAVEAINNRFELLVSQQHEPRPLLVIAPSLGDPRGEIVATEYIDATAAHVRQERGKPIRRLEWVTDVSTGLKPSRVP